MYQKPPAFLPQNAAVSASAEELSEVLKYKCGTVEVSHQFQTLFTLISRKSTPLSTEENVGPENILNKMMKIKLRISHLRISQSL
jgi:hypothetical protein